MTTAMVSFCTGPAVAFSASEHRRFPARTAVPRTLPVGVGVFRRRGMAVHAEWLAAVLARAVRERAGVVLLSRHRFQVLGVEAQAVPASVVDVQTRWDRA